jgi:hypothetical protein
MIQKSSTHLLVMSKAAFAPYRVGDLKAATGRFQHFRAVMSVRQRTHGDFF